MPEIVTIKTLGAIHQDMVDAVIASSNLSDEHTGSVLDTIIYAIASHIYEQHYRLYRATKGLFIRESRNKQLSNIVTNWGLERKEATQAKGVISFTASGAGFATIQPGTILTAPATASHKEVRFQTTNLIETNVSPASSVSIGVEAIDAGTAGNLKEGAISYLEASITNLASWTQKGPTKLGRKRESDSELLQRLISILDSLTRGQPSTLISQTLAFELLKVTQYDDIDASANEIQVYEDLTEIPIPTAGYVIIDSEVIEYDAITTSSFPHIIQVKAGGRGAKGTTATTHSAGAGISEYGAGTTRATFATLTEDFVNGALVVTIDDQNSTGPSAEFQELLEKRLRGDGTPRFGGYRGAGVTLAVAAIVRVNVKVEVKLQIQDGYDHAVVKAATEVSFVNFIHTLPQGKTAAAYSISCAIKDTEGVEGIDSLTINGVLFDGTTSADAVVAATEKAFPKEYITL